MHKQEEESGVCVCVCVCVCVFNLDLQTFEFPIAQSFRPMSFSSASQADL